MSRISRLINYLNILEPENEELISETEKTTRKILGIGYKVLWSVVFVWHAFDFLFSSIWMHGYIWSLNLPIDLDLSDKSAGAIVYHQMDMVGSIERLVYAVSCVFVISLFLICAGFASGRNSNVWDLFKLSVLVGVATGFIRTLQLKQRLFSSLHEGCFCYFITFVVGLILTLKAGERLPKPVKPEENKKKNE